MLTNHSMDRIGHYECNAVGPDDPTHSVCGAFIFGFKAPDDSTPCPDCDAAWLDVQPAPVYCKDHQ